MKRIFSSGGRSNAEIGGREGGGGGCSLKRRRSKMRKKKRWRKARKRVVGCLEEYKQI